MHTDHAAAPYTALVAATLRLTRAASITALLTFGLSEFVVLLTVYASHRDPTVLGVDVPVHAWWVVAGCITVQSLLLLLRLQFGSFLLPACVAVACVVAVVAPSAVFSLTALPIVVASFITGLHTLSRPMLWSASTAAGFLAVGHFVNAVAAGGGNGTALIVEAVAQAVVVVGVPLLPATAIAARRAAREADRRRLDALEREQNARIAQAIALERAGMARELHDIAAHHLSGIAVMASAVAHHSTIAPDAARTGALAIRQQATEVLDDMRRLVGVLRDTTDHPTVTTLRTITDLIDRTRDTGATVHLHVRPSLARLSQVNLGPLAQHTAYRMVQEALTNATRHAPAATCNVKIDLTGTDCILITVDNTAPTRSAGTTGTGEGGGFGIVGMTERATLIGAQFHAGPTPEGGWTNRMCIPRDHPDSPS